ncbi:MAG: type II toxin-antitoxin system prevent-host-death family antitoxin [Mariprofundaceae bacterium]|nr:type II toxin-antitoxin system prevent-host-death family antitoxin [Mariprofundaceae bacterium]
MTASRAKEVTAFDAKTHLSSLIRDVEEGHSFTITRRGKPVARLEPFNKPAGQATDDALSAFRAIRQRVTGSGSIRELIDEGRRY